MVRQPFSTILALTIMRLVAERDLELQGADPDRTAIDAKTADAVLAACQRTVAPLESVVDRILEIEEQMRLARS